jgi:hypothetical protein
MAIERHESGTTFTGPDIDRFKYATLLSGLKLECATGMTLSRGQSCYQYAKKTLGFKGNKLSVLKQTYDWFVLHVDSDGPLVRNVAKYLREKGLLPHE